MAKHSYEFKKQMVLEYLDNHGSYDSISQKHGMSSSSQLKTWVAAYQKLGDAGLKRSRSRKEYSFEEKLSVVNKRTLVSGTGSSNGNQQSVDACQMGK